MRLGWPLELRFVFFFVILCLFRDDDWLDDFNLLDLKVVGLGVLLFPLEFLLLFGFLVRFFRRALRFEHSCHRDVLDGQRRIGSELLPFVLDLLDDLHFWHGFFALFRAHLFVVKVDGGPF